MYLKAFALHTQNSQVCSRMRTAVSSCLLTERERVNSSDLVAQPRRSLVAAHLSTCRYNENQQWSSLGWKPSTKSSRSSEPPCHEALSWVAITGLTASLSISISRYLRIASWRERAINSGSPLDRFVGRISTRSLIFSKLEVVRNFARR